MKTLLEVGAVLGSWYPLHNSEIYSTIQDAPIFRDLTPEQVDKLIKAHDAFKNEVVSIFKEQNPG